MDHLPEILKVIEGGIARDPAKVSNYAELLATKLQSDGDEGAAKRVLSALSVHQATLRPKDFVARSIPVDGDSRVSLADVTYPSLAETKVVLTSPIRASIEDFILAHHRVAELVAAGLRGPGHLLLYGPPGGGKTQTASYIAASLDLPLVSARLDGLISSYLGTTAKNLRTLFEYVDRFPCVLLLDEFDAVAKMRDDPHELGELKRVVNSLLQNIDLLPPGTPVVAATNHPKLLDPAVWRRFEVHIEIGLPTRDARVDLFRLYLSPDLRPELAQTLGALTEGRSAADIRSACESIRREQVLRPTSGDDASTCVQLLLRHLARTRDGDGPEPSIDDQIRYLRAADPSLFTYEVIRHMLGVSNNRISRVLGESRGVDDDG